MRGAGHLQGSGRGCGRRGALGAGRCSRATDRHIDTAGIYRTEAEVGAALAGSGVPREAVYLVSKVSPYQQGAAKAAQACQDSLRQLATPYLDLMRVHWPGAAKQEAGSPANAALRRDTWRVLEAGQREGRLRAIGVSQQLHGAPPGGAAPVGRHIPPGGCCCRGRLHACVAACCLPRVHMPPLALLACLPPAPPLPCHPLPAARLPALQL